MKCDGVSCDGLLMVVGVTPQSFSIFLIILLDRKLIANILTPCLRHITSDMKVSELFQFMTINNSFKRPLIMNKGVEEWRLKGSIGCQS